MTYIQFTGIPQQDRWDAALALHAFNNSRGPYDYYPIPIANTTDFTSETHYLNVQWNDTDPMPDYATEIEPLLAAAWQWGRETGIISVDPQTELAALDLALKEASAEIVRLSGLI